MVKPVKKDILKKSNETIDFLILNSITSLQEYCQFVLRCPSGPGAFLYGGAMSEKIFKSYLQRVNIMRSRGMFIGNGSQGTSVMHFGQKLQQFLITHAKIFSF